MELPQGGWEMEIDNPEELARGELKEETGLLAEKMIYLGAHWIAYGFTRQKQHVFWPRDSARRRRSRTKRNTTSSCVTCPCANLSR